MPGRKRRRLSAALAISAIGLTVVAAGAWLFAMAFYYDDTSDQAWQTDLGGTVGVVALVLAAVVAVAAALAALFER